MSNTRITKQHWKIAYQAISRDIERLQDSIHEWDGMSATQLRDMLPHSEVARILTTRRDIEELLMVFCHLFDKVNK